MKEQEITFNTIEELLDWYAENKDKIEIIKAEVIDNDTSSSSKPLRTFPTYTSIQ